jgi:peptide-methionine (S)-S-oxide reductase
VRRPYFLAALGLVLVGALVWSLAGRGMAEDPPEAATAPTLAVATFAGGCFWCMEEAFDQVEGVVSTTSGYTGGTTPEPSYEDVSAGGTGHAEAVEVRYDPGVVTYARLLEVYWRNVDPLTADAQFCDHGDQYRTAIFYHDEEQRRLAEASKAELEESGRFDSPIVTQIVPAGPFYEAEEYHQDFSINNPIRYKYYRFACGRDARLAELWGGDE